MIQRPALARSMRAFAAGSDTVVITSPTGDFLLAGAVYEKLVQLLDGTRDAAALAEAVPEFGMPEVYYALRLLEAQQCITDGPEHNFQIGMQQVNGLSILTVNDPLTITHSRAGAWTFVSATPNGWWIGPRFGTGSTAPCIKCLEFKLAANRPIADFVRNQKLKEITPERPIGVLPEPVLAIVHRHNDSDVILELSADLRVSQRHVVHRRPECPSCGDSSIYAQAASKPVSLHGGPVSSDSEEFVRRYMHLLDPVTGIAREPRKLSESSVHVYIGGANRAHASAALSGVRQHLRAFASGKGSSDLNARASLIGELAERHSAVLRGDEPRLTGSMAELGERAINPNDVMLYSETQLRNRAGLQTDEDPIPFALPADERIDWTPVWSLTGQNQRFLPTALLYFADGTLSGSRYCIADSNGNAAGVTRDSAMLQGILELIERDAVGTWWFNRTSRQQIPLALFEDEWVQSFVNELESVDRRVWVLDITTDLEVPVYAAVSARTGDPEQIVFGFGAHVDARLAATRAVTELGQTIAVTEEIMRNESGLTPALRSWMIAATLAGRPFLQPAGTTALPPSITAHAEPAQAFEECRARLERAGLECLVLDQTRPDVGVPVVKMIVPGLRHYRRRLGPGRLYDTPVRTGILQVPNAEAELNPEVLAF